MCHCMPRVFPVWRCFIFLGVICRQFDTAQQRAACKGGRRAAPEGEDPPLAVDLSERVPWGVRVGSDRGARVGVP